MARGASGVHRRNTGEWVVRLRRPVLAHALLLISFLGGLGFLGHFPDLYFRDFSMACLVGLYLWLALSRRADSRWILRVYIPALALLAFILLYAFVFLNRVEGAPLLPSLLSQRRYTFFLLGPLVYMLYTRGWRLADFQRIFVLSALLVVASLVVYDVVFSPVSLILTGSFFTLYLTEITEETNATRVAEISVLFLTLYFGRRLFQARDAIFLALALAVVAFGVTLLLLTIPRGTLAGTIAALLLYAIFLSRPIRAKLLLVMFPLYAFGAVLLEPILTGFFLDTWGQDRTWLSRTDTVETAWGTFREYPLLGFGADSIHSVSYQSLFGEQFYTADIGLLGIAFQYGMLGVVLYVGLAGWILIKLLGLKWAYSGNVDPKHSAFMWTLLMIYLVLVIIVPLQTRFIYSEGLSIAALAWGLLMAHSEALRTAPSVKPRQKKVAQTAAESAKVGSS